VVDDARGRQPKRPGSDQRHRLVAGGGHLRRPRRRLRRLVPGPPGSAHGPGFGARGHGGAIR
jgi:hypothetical protein